VLDLAAWEFYVISTKTLNEKFGKAKSISLEPVQKHAAQCRFELLKETVDRVLSTIATAKAAAASQ
jgi:hypothetical protein